MKCLNNINKKAFTLIELVVVMAIIGILVLLAAPKFIGYTERAQTADIEANCRLLEDASELYYIDNQDWPRASDTPYTADQISSFADKIYNKTGAVVSVDSDGSYYPISYNSLSNYIKQPQDGVQYLIQNPVGEIYYLKDLTDKGKTALILNSDIPSTNGYAINVINGNSSVSTAKAGDSVIITANMPNEMNTVKWTVTPEIVITSGDLNSNAFTFTMPDFDVTITPTYSNYVLATNADFTKVNYEYAPNGSYYWNYTGTADYVEVPSIINGDTITNTYMMFKDTSVKGIKMNNPAVTNMSYMFFHSSAISLDLSSFDTSNVTNMIGMFEYSYATNLDLSKFDTSNVTTMQAMFYKSKANVLDLSSFNTSKVTTVINMFYGSQTTIGYAKTTIDATLFNRSANKPSTLTFVVKS